MSLSSIFSFNLANIRNDLIKKFDLNPKERVPLNLSKEATFTVQLRDPNMPNLRYQTERKLLVLEDGLHIIDPTTKTFRLNIDADDEWQIYYKQEGSKRFDWYTFISPQIVDNIVLDRTLFEPGEGMQ